MTNPSEPAADPESDSRRASRFGAMWASASQRGFAELTNTVRDMHLSIARRHFDAAEAITSNAPPVRAVRRVSLATTEAVYDVVRVAGTGLIGLAGWAADRSQPTDRGGEPPAPALRAGINAAFGDALSAAEHPLGIEMTLRTASGELVRDFEGPAGADVALFVHGLGADESCWGWFAEKAWGERSWTYGQAVAADLGLRPVYVRYNTGREIQENGAGLAALLDRWWANADCTPGRLVIVGHSMGGLVARRALHEGVTRKSPWAEKTCSVVCLGAPHAGAPLERVGDVITRALNAFEVTKALGALAGRRSTGIKDLRWGLDAPLATGGVPVHALAGNLGPRPDHPLGHVLGDGMVTVKSSKRGDSAPDNEAIEIARLGHLRMLNDPRVYEALRRWLATDLESTQTA